MNYHLQSLGEGGPLQWIIVYFNMIILFLPKLGEEPIDLLINFII